ncbi:CsbD family protein [Pseudomonas sp. LF245]
MGSTADKAKGLKDEAIGNIKQGIGKVTGNDKLRAEGVVQEKKGQVEKAIGDTKDAVKKAVK